MLHPNSAIERLYLPRREGGRGLSNLEHCCLKEEEKIANHFLRTNLPVHQWVNNQRQAPALARKIQVGEEEALYEKLKQE